jgi:plastocyanin
MRTPLVVLALAALLLAGCSSTPSAPLPAPPQDAEGRYMIQATTQNAFTPNEAQVPVGSTVIWKVAMGGFHDVNSKSGPQSFSSDAQYPSKMRGNDTFQFTFTKAGTYQYYCKVHEGMMAGTLKVA